MEYKGLWEEDTPKDNEIIYTVMELYDWHNDVPGFEFNVFRDSGFAQNFIKKRVKEISCELFGEKDVDWKEEEIERELVRVFPERYFTCDSICITDDNDYVHLFLFKGTIQKSIFC